MTVREGYEPSALTAAVLEEVRVTLARRRWSVAGFARRLGQSQSHVNAIMNGKSSLTVDALAAWCETLEVGVAELVNKAQESLPGSQPDNRDALIEAERLRQLESIHESMNPGNDRLHKQTKRTKRTKNG